MGKNIQCWRGIRGSNRAPPGQAQKLADLPAACELSMRIATKLYLGFGFLLTLMVALAGLVAYDMVGLRSGLGRLTGHEIPTVAADMRMARNLATEVYQAHTYIMNPAPWRLGWTRSAELLFENELSRALASSSGPDRAILQATAASASRMHTDIHVAEEMARTGHIKAAAAYWNSEAGPLQESVSYSVDQLRVQREARVAQSADAVRAQTAHLGPTSEAVALVALLAGIIAAIAIARSLLLPIRALVQAVDTLAAGDLTARVQWPYNDELGTLASDFNRMADRVAATITQLHQTQAALQERNEALSDAYGTLQQEMELAARIQREILPTDCRYLDIHGSADMAAASDIGGDFYDFLPGRPGPHQVGLVIGDVSGKGIAAALLMVFVVTILREICRSDSDPAAILQRLNRLMLHRFGPQDEMYATCFIGLLDRETLELTYSKAGHEEPFWYHASTGRCESLTAGGLFVGLFTDGHYETCRIQLHPGDRLVLYTDGIVEARNPPGKSFTADRLREVIENNGTSDSGVIIQEIKDTLDEWTGGCIPRDDMTLLVIEVPNSARPAVPARHNLHLAAAN